MLAAISESGAPTASRFANTTLEKEPRPRCLIISYFPLSIVPGSVSCAGVRGESWCGTLPERPLELDSSRRERDERGSCVVLADEGEAVLEEEGVSC